MLTKVQSFGIQGLDVYPITIEVDVSLGLPITHIVGLPDNAVKESKERVKSAIRNSNYSIPPRRITVNLSPADIKKEGPIYDLPIALGILAHFENINKETLSEYAVLGELSLDGQIQPIKGALSMTLNMSQSKLKGLIIPEANVIEASLCEHISIYPAKTLTQVVNFLNNIEIIKPFSSTFNFESSKKLSERFDFADVKGQWHAKRGLEIAAAGGHNAIFIGPPGSGKSMLAKRFPTILPLMNKQEILETTNIYSAMGLLKADENIICERPFRSPHHTTSDVAIVGGGSIPRSGEVTLSHNGVLFLDELPEFDRNVLESLRQPLEDHHVTISRAAKTSIFPADFILIAAMNPCPCGRLTSPGKQCQCHPHKIEKYLSKISGPLLDRIDLHIEVPALLSQQIMDTAACESSLNIQQRVINARNIQDQRFNGTSIKFNARMNHQHIKQFCRLSKEVKILLKNAIDELGLSARGYDKIIRLARTIADLENVEQINSQHMAEAIQYRSLDRK